MNPSVPGAPPNVGSQPGEHEEPSESVSGSTRRVGVAEVSATRALVTALPPALPTAVTCTLVASGGSSTSSR